MKTSSPARKTRTVSRPVNLARHFNWPRRVPKSEWWQELAAQVRDYPCGRQTSWGIPFALADTSPLRVIMVRAGAPDVQVPVNGLANYLCVLHVWQQIPETIRREDPTEGLVVGQYELVYADGTRHVQPVRARFELRMVESPGPAWLAVPFDMPRTADPAGKVPGDMLWGRLQFGIAGSRSGEAPLLYAMPNPCPDKTIRCVIIRGLQESPLLVAGLTFFRGAGHPFAHLPHRTYRVSAGGQPAKVKKADVDLGVVARIEQTTGPRGKTWLKSSYAGTSQAKEPVQDGESLLELVGAEDATVSVTLEHGKKDRRHAFSLGEAFHQGRSTAGDARLEVLGRHRQWMRVRVIDSSTGRSTPTRIHFSGSRGEYLAPHGHHAQINANWFEDYGADVVVGGRNYAYVHGEFTTDLPTGDLYVEINKGFEYEPVRRKVIIRPGQKELELNIDRWKNLRRDGWVTADTHVHFISPHTAWLEGEAEGVNVVNLLASQWGRLFTNVGDLTGRVGVAEGDTIVYVGTENRNHMLGHMSMLGTQGLPVYPMCCGGVTESWVGDPDFVTLAEWALENRRKGGVVIRPHFPFCGFTEDPVPILKGLVDALEINMTREGGFPMQEWYRYLNCGYRVAIVGGTDKMGASTALGWMRTYAQLDRNRQFDYNNWARAVRAGRTVSTNGPLMSLAVEGRAIGDAIQLPRTGGTLHVETTAESCWPLGKLEVVYNGRIVASQEARRGARRLHLRERVAVPGSGWMAARCYGQQNHPASYVAAHTSPVYLKCGDTRAFDGPAAEHMLALVEGGMEYLQTLATVFDEHSRRRMVKLFKEAQAEIKGRLVVEARHAPHHGDGAYHTHGQPLSGC
ncbi:MAG: CehA/McbA family metallohydrolase [Verrucomicrobia bacterium]|nr:CehA/McbA family metallohydrolase [Verrucomicrobiota bacterium]MBU4286140.1 CehA/McbA family metallohydrolase [Verrucomicrobiota bacterium]MBU4365892.1 CehA/McbA family metallohydrolase [Verrucomicrobiota bacterium]